MAYKKLFTILHSKFLISEDSIWVSMPEILSEKVKKGADQSAQMPRLICVFVVGKPQIQVFSRRGPYKYNSFGENLKQLVKGADNLDFFM